MKKLYRLLLLVVLNCLFLPVFSQEGKTPDTSRINAVKIFLD